MVRMLNLWSRGCGFDSCLGCCQVVTNWLSDHLGLWSLASHQSSSLTITFFRSRSIEYQLMTLMPEPIWFSPAVQTSSSAGNVTGPAISALRTSCALAILHCWQDIAIELGAGTSPPVHIATAPTRRQSTWCYSVQPTTRSGQISGLEENLARILDAFGTSWSGLGRLPASPHLTGSERTSVLACLAGVKLATPNNV